MADIKAYGDGRVWDNIQRHHVNDILNKIRDNLDKDDLEHIRKDTLWLMDVVFPTGFVYKVNRSPSEDVHGGMMYGENDAA